MTAQNTANTQQFRKTMSASTLIGDKVSNSQEENLGSLKEIMLDVDTGKVAYGVLETGAVLGLGGKLLAIPWEAFGVDESHHRLILDVPKETLKNAEGFDKDDWPDVTDVEFGRRTHEYYGYNPYWETS